MISHYIRKIIMNEIKSCNKLKIQNYMKIEKNRVYWLLLGKY